jgi:hypothetical protein
MSATRLVLIHLLLALISITLPAHAATLTFKPSGQPRAVRGPLFGASTTAFYEHLLDDPVKIKTVEPDGAVEIPAFSVTRIVWERSGSE